MKRFVLLLSLFLLLPATVSAAEEGLVDKLKGAAKKLMGQGSSGAGGPGAMTDEKPKQYIIHLNNGGEIDADNYTFEKDKIRIEMASGAVYLDKSLVKSIEEVAGPDLETVQEIKVQPTTKAKDVPPHQAEPVQPKKQMPQRPGVDEAPSVPVDDNGHDEAWWHKRVNEWKKKKADAQARFDRAQSDWNKYNGLVTTSPAGVSQYDQLRFEDIRGASRVDMDEAQGQLDEASRMLNEVIPDEARKAGAPPGWVRD